MSGPTVQENGTNYPNGNMNRNRSGSVSNYQSKVTVVLGAQWGDEGKGKVVDMLATEVDVVCRCQVRIAPKFSCCLALFLQKIVKKSAKSYKVTTIMKFEGFVDHVILLAFENRKLFKCDKS